jgi:SAM-dependent methyltransferase
MLLSTPELVTTDRTEQSTEIMLRCPGCFRSIGHLKQAETAVMDCFTCGLRLSCERGIWKALLRDRENHYSKFINDYESIRASEGRGSTQSDYYLALPYQDLSGLLSSQWAIRARTFRYIERNILPRVASLTKNQLRVLDLGAGNCWMSYRLQSEGHAPVAVDLLTNDHDGLRAANHYTERLGSLFPRVQAELDDLPFADSQFDVAIFNASFHYSENYEKTMAEALRCVRNGGMVVIADTPWYSDEWSGLRMLEERRAFFVERYGFPSDALQSLEFLTDERLAAMERRLSIRWQTYAPFYGMRWHLRPLLARLRRARKPSRFRIYSAKVVK